MVDKRLEELNLRIETTRNQTVKQIAQNMVKNLDKSPFEQDILNQPVPRQFTMSKSNSYDGSSDPIAHLHHYQ